MKWWRHILILGLFLTPTLVQAEDPSSTIFFRDAKNYLETIEKAEEVKLEDQLEVWRNFLIQYPDTYFRDEIHYNLSQLEKILGVQPKVSQELTDTHVFLKAQKYISKNNLSTKEQILLWKQFLSEQPKNKHNSEVRSMISELQFALQKK